MTAIHPDPTPHQRAQTFVSALSAELTRLGHTVETTTTRSFNTACDGGLAYVPETVDGHNFGFELNLEKSGYGSRRYGQAKRLTCTLGKTDYRRHTARGRQAYREPNDGYSPTQMAARIVKIVAKMTSRATEEELETARIKKVKANFRALLAVIDPAMLEAGTQRGYIGSQTTVDDVDYAEMLYDPTKVEVTIEATNEEALAIKAFLQTLRSQ